MGAGKLVQTRVLIGQAMEAGDGGRQSGQAIGAGTWGQRGTEREERKRRHCRNGTSRRTGVGSSFFICLQCMPCTYLPTCVPWQLAYWVACSLQHSPHEDRHGLVVKGVVLHAASHGDYRDAQGTGPLTDVQNLPGGGREYRWKAERDGGRGGSIGGRGGYKREDCRKESRDAAQTLGEP